MFSYVSHFFEPESEMRGDFRAGFQFGTLYMFSSVCVTEILKKSACHPYCIGTAQAAVGSLFELIYGFSYATGGRTLMFEAAKYFELSDKQAGLLADAVYCAVTVAQDTTPLGMMRSSTYLAGKCYGYGVGMWAAKWMDEKGSSVISTLSNLKC